MFCDDGAFAGLPLVTNCGSTRLYESVAEKGVPGFKMLIPYERPEAYKVKIAVAMEIPRESHLIYSVDEGALRTGLKFTFEELAPDRTRVSFTIDELTGDGAKGLEVNRSTLKRIARDALGKLDDFEKVEETACSPPRHGVKSPILRSLSATGRLGPGSGWIRKGCWPFGEA